MLKCAHRGRKDSTSKLGALSNPKYPSAANRERFQIPVQ